ncbi:hypothetical protein ILYODFUR_024629 [Ilyodon furcidens]|uniref:Uncharacterized protein n=1 Tax=Ilyodon furcidens TaxID=33524 RepID=A0ABV0V8F0_9TELE
MLVALKVMGSMSHHVKNAGQTGGYDDVMMSSRRTQYLRFQRFHKSSSKSRWSLEAALKKKTHLSRLPTFIFRKMNESLTMQSPVTWS